MKHRVDPKTGITAEQAVWHADPNMEALVVDIFDKVKPAAFVETGTHMGWTALWVAGRYAKVDVYTAEIDKTYFHLSGENLAGQRTVFRTVFRQLGDSREFLRGTSIAGLPFFWLDAHGNAADHPLREECEIVSSVPRCIILIDDFHCGADFPGDPATHAGVEAALGKDYWRPAYPYQTGFSGYALFVRGLDYTPPPTMRRAT